MAWVVKRAKLNFKKVFFWDTLIDINIHNAKCNLMKPKAVGGAVHRSAVTVSYTHLTLPTKA